MSHLGGAAPLDTNTYMQDVFGYLLVKYEIRSVIDIGCGFGQTLKWFGEHGLCNVTGVEGWDEAIEKNVIPQDRLIKHDFTTGPLNHGIPYDLAWSAEFVEHVDEKFIPNFMPAFRLARYAVITHGEPGQHGYNHVNCQTSEYWIEKFAQHGFTHDAGETALLRRTDRWKAGWGRRSLLFFRRTR
jgi:hypothetical protein